MGLPGSSGRSQHPVDYQDPGRGGPGEGSARPVSPSENYQVRAAFWLRQGREGLRSRLTNCVACGGMRARVRTTISRTLYKTSPHSDNWELQPLPPLYLHRRPPLTWENALSSAVRHGAPAPAPALPPLSSHSTARRDCRGALQAPETEPREGGAPTAGAGGAQAQGRHNAEQADESARPPASTQRAPVRQASKRLMRPLRTAQHARGAAGRATTRPFPRRQGAENQARVRTRARRAWHAPTLR